MKKLLAICLCLAVMFGVTPAFADYVYEYGDDIYAVHMNGVLRTNQYISTKRERIRGTNICFKSTRIRRTVTGYWYMGPSYHNNAANEAGYSGCAKGGSTGQG